jgi:hypothetical protein
MEWSLSIVSCASWDGGLREGGEGLWPKCSWALMKMDGRESG